MVTNFNARAWNDYEPCSKTVSMWCLELYEKNSKMPVHCTAHHHHQLVFFSTPTPIKTQLVMMEARRRVQPGVQRTLQYYSFCYKKQRRVVEIEIRVEIET